LYIFEDRIELYSPGSPPNSMSIDSMHLRNVSRNEAICAMLSRRGLSNNFFSNDRKHFMDRRGEGVPLILEEATKFSGKKPVYQIIDDSEVLLTIFPYAPN
jgi:ATP-dependent DNA helicase RecG